MERDHWPVGKKLGGKHIIHSCGTCHHMKDRITLLDWPINWFVRAEPVIGKLRFLWMGLSREERIFLAKSLSQILILLNNKRHQPTEIIDSLNDYVTRFHGTLEERERLEEVAAEKREEEWKS